MLIKIMRFFFGTVLFKVSGKFSERFLNVCSKNNIVIWGARRKDGVLYCRCLAKDFKKFKVFRRKCGVKIKLVSKKGLPFLRKRYHLRIGMIIGAALFFLILNVLSASIWNIQIKGNEAVSEERIMEALRKIGVDYSVKRNDIDTKEKKLQLLMEIPELSWAAVNIEGSIATIDVKEVIKQQDISDKTPCNLRAKADGIIIKSTVTEGEIKFQLGDAVRTGDLLVSGTTEFSGGETRFSHAKGEVIAKTERRLEYKATFSQTEIKRTGKVTNKKVFTFFGFDIPLYLGSVKFPYQKEKKINALEFNGVELPILITGADFFETSEQKYTISREEAEALAIDKVESMEKDELADIKIVSRDIKVRTDDQGVKVIATYLCEENITYPEIILISSSIS